MFDRAFAGLMLGDGTGEWVRVLRRVAAASEMPRSWPAFCAPLEEVVDEQVLSAEKLDRWRATSLEAAEVLGRFRGVSGETATDIDELALACRLNALMGERFAISRRLAGQGGVPDAGLAQRLARFAQMCEDAIPEYEAAWLARHKPSGLREVTAVFQRLAGQARAIAGKLREA